MTESGSDENSDSDEASTDSGEEGGDSTKATFENINEYAEHADKAIDEFSDKVEGSRRYHGLSLQKIDEATKDIDDEVNDVLDATASSSIESPSKEEELEEGEKREKVDEEEEVDDDDDEEESNVGSSHHKHHSSKEKLAVEATAEWEKMKNRVKRHPQHPRPRPMKTVTRRLAEINNLLEMIPSKKAEEESAKAEADEDEESSQTASTASTASANEDSDSTSGGNKQSSGDDSVEKAEEESAEAEADAKKEVHEAAKKVQHELTRMARKIDAAQDKVEPHR